MQNKRQIINAWFIPQVNPIINQIGRNLHCGL